MTRTAPLYHHTCRESLPSIFLHGLDSGKVQTKAWINADGSIGGRFMRGVVWLTTDPDPSGHGLTSERREIRIQVDLPRNTTRLVAWQPYAAKRFNRADLHAFNKAGEGKATTWFFYRGRIGSRHFVEVIDHRTGESITAAHVQGEPVVRLPQVWDLPADTQWISHGCR